MSVRQADAADGMRARRSRVGPDGAPATASRWVALHREPRAWFGVAGLVAVAGFTFLGPLFYHGDPNALHMAAAMRPPGGRFPLGTDALGRDEMARMIYGGQMALLVGFLSAVTAMAIGVMYGLIAGFVGGPLDAVMMRLVDLLRAVPVLFLLLILDAALKPSAATLVIIIAAVAWHEVSRLVRADVLSLKERTFVESARAVGARPLYIMWRYLFPGTLGVVLVATTFRVADAILTIAALSFLGLGLPPPAPNWGSMLSNAMPYIPQNSWWLIYPPGVALLVTLVCLNFLGDAVHRVVTPRRQIRRWHFARGG